MDHNIIPLSTLCILHKVTTFTPIVAYEFHSIHNLKHVTFQITLSIEFDSYRASFSKHLYGDFYGLISI
jgi:hypothetical protein